MSYEGSKEDRALFLGGIEEGTAARRRRLTAPLRFPRHFARDHGHGAAPPDREARQARGARLS